jgi:hypothetical protein
MNKVGASFENAMTGAFTWWGTKAALYPLPVIVLSIGFAAGLSSGEADPNVLIDYFVPWWIWIRWIRN